MAKGKYQQWLEPDNLTLLKGFARNGYTDEDIAQKMGISAVTLYEWKKRFPQIAKALKKGKDVIDDEIEETLIKSAMGYSYDEVIKELRKNDETDEVELVVTRVVRKHQPPNVTALIFWLKNRRRESWRDKISKEDLQSENILLSVGDVDAEKK
ncbi:MAG: helix-turn-helix domain-containing protein [Veillonella caviae]|nr:helix-turn-helix domain-containing protein [Veillonella caviae]